MPQPRLLFLAGSLRKGSLNKQLAKGASVFAETSGAAVTYIDPADFPLPVFNEDSAFPAEAAALKNLFVSHDGIFIASPEYNGQYPGALKNLLDWVSRPQQKDETPLRAFSGKVFAISSMSPGPMGGLRGLIALRAALGCLPCHIVPSQAAVSGADGLDDAGMPNNPRARAMLEQCLRELADTALKLGSAAREAA